MEPMTEFYQENVDLLVHAYVDDELDVANGLAIKRKIDADPALANSAAEIKRSNLYCVPSFQVRRSHHISNVELTGCTVRAL